MWEREVRGRGDLEREVRWSVGERGEGECGRER